MQILKEHKKKESGWMNEFICTGEGHGKGGCEATLLVDEKDLYFSSTEGGMETNRSIGFICPSCGITTDVDVPADVTQRVKERIDQLLDVAFKAIMAKIREGNGSKRGV